MAKKQQPNPLTDLANALAAVLERTQHFSWFGGATRENLYEDIRIAKQLLNPNLPAEVTQRLREYADTLDGVVASQRQAADRRENERLEAQATAQHIRDETAKRREEARLERLRMGATPLG